MSEYWWNNNIVSLCSFHVVFCLEYGRKCLVGDVAKRLKELVLLKAEELNVSIAEFELLPDHVHILLQCDPQFGIHRVVKQYVENQKNA